MRRSIERNPLLLRIKRDANPNNPVHQCRQKLEKEAKHKGCKPERRTEIVAELAGLVYQEQQGAVLRAIRTQRQKLKREVRRMGYSAARRKAIEQELVDLIQLEHQECGTGGPQKHPSSRPTAKELSFATAEPSVNEIIERAIIQQGLRLGKPELMFAKLVENDAARWGHTLEREANLNPKIKRARERIQFGDIKEAAETKFHKVDRIIAEHYFKSTRLRLPLRALSADKASTDLIKLGVDISPDGFDRALRRLALVVG